MNKKQYIVWKVFDQYQELYYVINVKSSKVQSVWKRYLDASKTCDKLNMWVDTKVV